MSAATQPIIIIKKKGHHAGHHGGAWKVAYADFVTAMMALFMVMWLMNASPEVKKAVGGYFKDPKGTGHKTGTNVGGSTDALTLTKTDMKDLKDKLEKAIKKQPEFEKMKDNVEMTITGEGLRIELLETEKGMFFKAGAPLPTDVGKDLLVQLSKELTKLKNPLMIEGHTDSVPYGKDDYTNWELSADRANAARRIMQASGLAATQVAQVRGFADQRLRVPAKPEDASNRRVSIIVRYSADDPQLADAEPAKGEKKAGGEHAAGAAGEKHGDEKHAGEEKRASEEKPKPAVAEKAAEGKPAAHG